MAKPKLTGGMYRNRSEYFADVPGPDTDKGARPGQLKDGYSRVAHQDAPDPVAYTQSRTAQKGGGFKYGEKQYIYEKVKAPEQVAAAPVPEPTPEPAKEQPEAPVTPSDTLQDAINTVKAKGPRTTTYTPNTTDAERRALTDSFS